MLAARQPNGDIEVTLRYDEALLLSDCLERVMSQQDGGTAQDDAERRLWSDLNSVFEPLIDEAFSDGYSEALERARQTVRDAPG
jgi:hypothetical protein